jgi:hypothetical protein
MSNRAEEIERRKIAALSAIKRTLKTEEGEYGSTLFTSHHLEEIEPSYWE